MGQHDKALADYNMVIQLEPDYADPYAYRAALYELMGQQGEALADYNMVIQLRPDSA